MLRFKYQLPLWGLCGWNLLRGLICGAAAPKGHRWFCKNSSFQCYDLLQHEKLSPVIRLVLKCQVSQVTFACKYVPLIICTYNAFLLGQGGFYQVGTCVFTLETDQKIKTRESLGTCWSGWVRVCRPHSLCPLIVSSHLANGWNIDFLAARSNVLHRDKEPKSSVCKTALRICISTQVS